MRYVLIIVTMVTALVAALTVFGTDISAQPADHIGTICVSCHKNYTDNPVISKFSPCSKSTCHRSNPTGKWGQGPRNRYSIHIQKAVCINCHTGTPEKFDIHAVHGTDFKRLDINRTAVECTICHWTPEGYNSSIARVPAYENLYVAGSAIKNTSIRRPPWGGNCSYCHESVSNATRLHDVHRPVLNTACKSCHGKVIENRPDLIARVVGESSIPGIPGNETKKNGSRISKKLFGFFDEIVEIIMSVFT